MRPLDVKTLEKLRKIWAMRGSPYEGEVEAAKTRAEIIVKPFGYALADVEGLLRAAESRPAGSPWPASKGRVPRVNQHENGRQSG